MVQFIVRRYVIIIPWAVRLYVEIIHELQRVDYLMYMWKNIVSLFYTTYIIRHKIFHAKVSKGGIKGPIPGGLL